MRTIIDIDEQQISRLDTLARRDKRSRAAVIRLAVDEYLAKHAVDEIDSGFGLWKGSDVDGLDYQRKLRSEW
jgi:predicted transcriptional regulator